MSELIEREPLFNAIYDLACASVSIPGCEDYATGLREAAHYVEEAPAIVVPREVGEWINVEDGMPKESQEAQEEYDPLKGILHSKRYLVGVKFRDNEPIVGMDLLIRGRWSMYGDDVICWSEIPKLPKEILNDKRRDS